MELHQEDSASSGSSFKLSDDSGIEDSWQELDDNGVQKNTAENLESIMLDTDLSRAFQGVALPTILSQESVFPGNSEPQKDQLTNSPTQFGPFPLALPYYDTNRYADVEDDGSSPYRCGLKNIGNTCFINAAIQCLLVTPFSQILSQEEAVKHSPTHNSNQFLAKKKLKEIFEKLASGKYSCVSTKEFHEALTKCGCPFTDFKQHDCQEFILYLLNIIHDVSKGNNILDETTNGNDTNEEGSKRLRLDTELSETDAGVECEDTTSDSHIAWKRHMVSNNSPVADNFFGQFKSTVTCEKCGNSSQSYESFMCLSLPIPYAMEQQIEICWMPLKVTPTNQPTRFLLVVKKSCVVRDLFQSLNDMFSKTLHEQDVIFAEIEGQHLSRILNLDMNTKYMDKKKHQIMAYEVKSIVNSSEMNDSNPAEEEKPANDISQPKRVHSKNEGTEATLSIDETPLKSLQTSNISCHTCTICLEEMFDDELFMHLSCGGAMCQPCLQTTASFHNNASFACPVCNVTVETTDFTKCENSENAAMRIVTIPRIIRNVSGSTSKVQLIGLPGLIQVPSISDYTHLKSIVEKTLPDSILSLNWCLKITNHSGLLCSRCCLPTICTGCLLTGDTDVKLKAGDAVTVELHSKMDQEMLECKTEFVDDISVQSKRENDVIHLRECLDAFTKTEWLGTDNPWHCNTCQQNRTAVKSITISRLPSTLIIHLKRFYFDEGVSKKITNPIAFPSENLSIPLTSSTNSEAETVSFDLLGIVNHVGSLTGGHYTALTRYPNTEKWISYSDDVINESMTTKEYNDKAYLLMYERQT